MRKIFRYFIAAVIIVLALMIISVVRNWDVVQAYFDSFFGYILGAALSIMTIYLIVRMILHAVLS